MIMKKPRFVEANMKYDYLLPLSIFFGETIATQYARG